MSLGGCPEVGEPIIGLSWARHTIYDDFNGADGVKLGDLNGDGLTDLAVAWEESGRVTAHFNPGGGAVTREWPTVVVGSVNAPEDALIVDLDGDGQREVLSASEGSDQITVHRPPSDPADFFNAAAWTSTAIGVTRGGNWLQVVPFRFGAAGGVELLVGSKDGNGLLGWLEAPANPTNLAGFQLWTLADADWIMSAVPVDANGDGAVDVIYSDRKGADRGVYLLTNPVNEILQRLPWPRQAIVTDLNAEPLFIDVGDLDGDGQLDVVIATDTRSIIWARRGVLGLGWTDTEITIPDDYGTGKAVRIADVNGDGENEIVFTCENAGGDRRGVGYLRQRGRGWEVEAISSTGGSKFDAIQLLDVDGDGDLDVLTTEESTGLGVIWYENPF